MNRYIQATLFPELDSQYVQSTRRVKRVKRLPKETALDLFPRRERQLAFEDCFPGFKIR